MPVKKNMDIERPIKREGIRKQKPDLELISHDTVANYDKTIINKDDIIETLKTLKGLEKKLKKLL